MTVLAQKWEFTFVPYLEFPKRFNQNLCNQLLFSSIVYSSTQSRTFSRFLFSFFLSFFPLHAAFLPKWMGIDYNHICDDIGWN